MGMSAGFAQAVDTVGQFDEEDRISGHRTMYTVVSVALNLLRNYIHGS